MSALLAPSEILNRKPAHGNPFWKRRTMVLSRWLHIYVSMASFGILFFFAVTGLTLNHVDWFTKQQRTTQVRGSISPGLLGADVQKLEIVEFVRNTHHVHGAVKDFRIEQSDLSIAFKAPGYAADVFVDRASGRYELTETRMGFFAIMNDLHKGRDAGSAWALVIDISAGLMTLVSLTGLLLIFFLQKRRLSGLLAAGAGAMLCYLAYAAWAP